MTLVLEGTRKARRAVELNGHKVDQVHKSNALDDDDSIETELSRLSLHTEQPPAQSIIGLAGELAILSKNPLKCHCPTSQAMKSVQFTQRGYLSVLTLSHLLGKDPSQAELASLLLAHTVLLEKLSLSHRRPAPARVEAKFDSQASSFIQQFSSIASRILMQNDWATSMDTDNVKCDLADLIDGQLFYSLAHLDENKRPTNELPSSFGPLAHALCALSGKHLKLFSGNDGSDKAIVPSNGTVVDDLSILPFSNTVFNQHLISIDIAIAKPVTDRQMGRIHREITHWHNAKRPLIVKAATPVNPRDAKRIMKRNDFFMAEMQAYAASLTNATGKSLEPEIVTVSDKPIVKAAHSKDKSDAIPGSRLTTLKPLKSKTTGKKPSGKQAMLNDIAVNKAIKDNESVDKVFSAWRIVRTDLAAEKSLQSQYVKVTTFLNSLPDVKRAILKPEVQWNLLNILLTMYTILSKEKDSQRVAEKYSIAALLFDTARKVATSEGLTKTIAIHLQTVVDSLRLPSIDIPMPLIDRKLAYDPGMRLTGKGELDIGLECQKFQLEYFGPYMDRNLDSAPDSRVPFEPDGWQRKVLDELDEDHSVFVVAPTSAGKTFISFYAMERILRASDDGVLGEFSC